MYVEPGQGNAPHTHEPFFAPEPAGSTGSAGYLGLSCHARALAGR